MDSIDELKLISTSSSILNDDDVRAFDCGYQELNDIFLDIYNKYDEESGHVLAIVNQNFELLGFISCRLVSFSLLAQGKEMGISIDDESNPWILMSDDLSDLIHTNIYLVETFDEIERYIGYLDGIERMLEISEKRMVA